MPAASASAAALCMIFFIMDMSPVPNRPAGGLSRSFDDRQRLLRGTRTGDGFRRLHYALQHMNMA
jgi:hypothetical protein